MRFENIRNVEKLTINKSEYNVAEVDICRNILGIKFVSSHRIYSPLDNILSVLRPLNTKFTNSHSPTWYFLRDGLKVDCDIHLLIDLKEIEKKLDEAPQIQE